MGSSQPDDRTTARAAAPGLPVPLLAGGATAVAGAGAALALTDIGSPLRAPFILFFLLLAPGASIAAALPRLDPLSRTVLAFGVSVVVNLLTAQCMIVLRMWSARSGVLVITAFSAALLLYTLAARRPAAGRKGR